MDNEERVERVAKLEARLGSVDERLKKVEGEYKELREDFNSMAVENRGMSEKVNTILAKLEEIARQKIRAADIVLSVGMLAIAIMTYLK